MQRRMLWRPSMPAGADNPFQKLTPKGSDWYITVDEIEDDWVRLVVAQWPSVEPDGRLRFPEPSFDDDEVLGDPSDWEWQVKEQLLHAWLSQQRSKAGQDAPERPVRIGDTYWYRGKFQPGAQPSDNLSGRVLDITYAARGEAKAAMAWAVTGTTMASPDLIVAGAVLDEESADPSTEDQEAGVARPSVPGSVASPSI